MLEFQVLGTTPLGPGGNLQAVPFSFSDLRSDITTPSQEGKLRPRSGKGLVQVHSRLVAVSGLERRSLGAGVVSPGVLGGAALLRPLLLPIWWLCRLSPGGGEVKWQFLGGPAPSCFCLQCGAHGCVSLAGALSPPVGSFALSSVQTWLVCHGDRCLSLPPARVSEPVY